MEVVVAERHKLEFFVLRYVPNVVRGEFVNFGVVMFDPAAGGSGFAEVRFARNWDRVRQADGQADVEFLDALQRDIRRQLADVRDRETLIRTIEDSFSNLIQASPREAVLAERPELEIEQLAKFYLEAPKLAQARDLSERKRILSAIELAFKEAGVASLIMKHVPAKPYTKAGDPFAFDFGYQTNRDGILKLFHAVPLGSNVDQALLLAARYPAIAEGIRRIAKLTPMLTAVIDDEVLAKEEEKEKEELQFVLSQFADQEIRVAPLNEMPQFAAIARQDLLK
jgi:DUF3037 family protein